MHGKFSFFFSQFENFWFANGGFTHQKFLPMLSGTSLSNYTKLRLHSVNLTEKNKIRITCPEQKKKKRFKFCWKHKMWLDIQKILVHIATLKRIDL